MPDACMTAEEMSAYLAAEFPQVRFEHAGGYKTAPNVATANARYYEGRYLAGVAAGTTVTSKPADTRRSRMLCLIPKS